jgi:ribosomal protein S18 acetylase RimI-like enzyme
VAPERSWAWRYATPEDAPALVELLQAAYRSGRGWTSEARLVEGSRTDLEAVLGVLARSSMLVVFDGADPIACCRLENMGDGVVHLGMLAVDPSQQSSGLGGWLLGQAEVVARERFGGRVLELKALEQQSALVAWYERVGFVRTGESEPFPGHPQFARPLRDGLRFAVLRKSLAA